jgi:hypothetical protein
MSFKKVAFWTAFRTDQPDPQPEEASVYQKKKRLGVKKAQWMAMSTLSCRDFTKSSYDYRDKNFILADEGISYELPKHLGEVYRKQNEFEKTEFRKVPLKPGKFRNENKTIYRPMHESSGETFTHVER